MGSRARLSDVAVIREMGCKHQPEPVRHLPRAAEGHSHLSTCRYAPSPYVAKAGSRRPSVIRACQHRDTTDPALLRAVLTVTTPTAATRGSSAASATPAGTVRTTRPGASGDDGPAAMPLYEVTHLATRGHTCKCRMRRWDLATDPQSRTPRVPTWARGARRTSSALHERARQALRRSTQPSDPEQQQDPGPPRGG